MSDTFPASPDTADWPFHPVVAFRLGLLVLAVTGTAVTVAYLHISSDDAFITYRYAANLAAGRGLVYNPGQHFLGTTAPFYALLLGLLARHHPGHVPAVAAILSGLSLTLTGCALLCLGRQAGHAACGLLAGLLYVVNPLADWAFGGESLAAAALIAWAFVLYRGGRTDSAALLLAAAVLTRPDSLAAVASLAGSAILTRRAATLKTLGRGALLLVLPLLCGALACHAYFGAPLPATFGAKLAQTRSGLWAGFWGGGVGWLSDVGRVLPGGHALGLLAAIGALFVSRVRARRFPCAEDGPSVELRLSAGRYGFWLLPLGWVALHVAGYVALGLPFYFWYLVPVGLGLSALAAAGLAGLGSLAYRMTGTRWGRIRLAVAFLGVTAFLIGAQLSYAYRFAHAVSALDAYLRPGPDTLPRVPLYRDLGQWLGRNTPPGASVGYIEVGAVGYYSGRVVVDPLGLVTPGAAAHVAKGDLSWAYRQARPDYIVDNPDFDWALGGVRTAPWFVRAYAAWARVPRPGATPITIYRRVQAK